MTHFYGLGWLQEIRNSSDKSVKYFLDRGGFVLQMITGFSFNKFRKFPEIILSPMARIWIFAKQFLGNRFVSKSAFLLGFFGFTSFALLGCLPQENLMDPSTLAGIIANAGAAKDFKGLLSAQTQSATKVQLTWTSSTDSNIVGYAIYDTTITFEPKLIKTITAPASETSVTGLKAGTFYSFRVRAYDAKMKDDGNVIDVGAITYGGIISADVKSSTTALLTFSDGSNADKIMIYCKVGIAAFKEELIAVFTDTSLTQGTITNLTAGQNYTCRAVLSIGGVEDNNLETVSFIPLGQATQIAFISQPSSGSAGVVLPVQPVVQILDSSGNVLVAGPDSSAQVTLTLAIDSPTGGAVVGSATVSAVKGVATFSGLSFQEAGSKVLTATKSDTSAQTNGSGPLVKNSDSFAIAPGAISAVKSWIAISPAVPPGNALLADGNATYTVNIALKDQYGNAVPGVKPQFVSSISGDNLSQPVDNTDALGLASGSISSTIADEVTPYRELSVSSPSGLSTVKTFAPFVAGAATKLVFAVQPVNSPAGTRGVPTLQVAVVDTNGNIVRSGTAATSMVNLTISNNVNGAILTGTASAQAVNGLATFGDLGIDKSGTGYKLQASSGNFIAAYSNTFNVTSGTPVKIAMTSLASSVTSGSCSRAITLQLQDGGNNSANAVQNTSLIVSGLGSASLFLSSACSGTALTSTIVFTAGASTKTVYLKDSAGEALTISVRDSSNVLRTGTLAMNVNPNKISVAAVMPAPAVAGTAMSVISGACSPAMTVTPTGDNGNASPLFALTPVALTGLNTSSALLYADAACTVLLDPLNFNLPITSGTSSNTIALYLKDPKAELFYLNITDPASVMTTTSSNQLVTILPSNITFSGPSSVIAGKCSTVFTVTLKDAQGNSVSAIAATILKINGLTGSTTGGFYASPSCTGTKLTSEITVPQNVSTLSIYFSDTKAEALHVFLSDKALQMAPSDTLAIGISPAGFQITGPSQTNSNTTACAGPFLVNTMDGASPANVTAAIAPIQMNIALSGYPTGFADAGAFFSDSACSNQITSVSFAEGVSAQQFYFQGQYPATSITFTGTDAANILSYATFGWAVKAYRGWIGTAGSLIDSLGNMLWFRSGVAPVSARMDAPSSVRTLHFDSTKTFLYVVDQQLHRVLKYDYVNKKYIGWIGGFSNPNNATALIRGSNQSISYPDLPSSAACVSTTSGATTPGWCLGGQSYANGNSTAGAMYNPISLTDDGTYIYVTQTSAHTVVRYYASSGQFAGWIGGVSVTPTGSAAGGPGTCASVVTGQTTSVTPGWCMGGTNMLNASASGSWGYGNGAFANPNAITSDGTYIYVANSGAILRYTAASGAFAGWIGKTYNTTPTSGAAGCTTLANGSTTPGWCFGGSYYVYNPRSLAGTPSLAGGVNNPTALYIKDGILYSVSQDSGSTIATYDVNTGEFKKILTGLSSNWLGAQQITYDSNTNYFYVADSSRVIAIDSTGMVIGWLGKVNNNSSLSNSLGNLNDCSLLAINANTPGWCLGGSARSGMDEKAFAQAYAIENDGQGNILVGQYNNPSIKKFNSSTGEYLGTLVYSSVAPTSWSTNANLMAEYYGFGDGDFWQPTGSYSDGTYLYVADSYNGRIKKINLSTGKTIGWVGAVTSTPTGGTSTSCLTANPMSPSPGWCLGATPNPWYPVGNFTGSSVLNSLFYLPMGITGDGTYIYVVDQGLSRIMKLNASTGAFVGWIGSIGTSPTGGDTGCNGATVGTFTPGWCTGGYPAAGTGNGMLANPSGITYVPSSGKLYVVDNNNHRISSYNATTGAFTGWIGRTSVAPSGGCTVALNASNYNVSTSGWCMGGTSQATPQGDKGGGFYFWPGNTTMNGITTDGTNLYVANFYNYRIDKISLNGVWLGAAYTRWDLYTLPWDTNTTTVSSWGTGTGNANFYPTGLWTDGTNIYGNVNTGQVVWKMSMATGKMLGWQGGILPGGYPSAGDTGCAGATTNTPGWCQGGSTNPGYKLGQFSTSHHMSGDSNFIYVTDRDTNRVTRLPK